MTVSQRLHERCACAGAHGPFSLAGTERKYERSRPYRVSHLFVDLTLDFDDQSVRGRAILDFERAAPEGSELSLDAVGFELGGVQLETDAGLEPADYDYDAETLTVRGLAERGKLHVEYSVKPARGLYFLAPDQQVSQRPLQAWTQCQDEDARHFIPCVDKPHMKMTTELLATVPQGFQVLSNGDLVGDAPSGEGPWTYRFRLDSPHPSYLLTLVAGHFDVVEDRPAQIDGRAVPIKYLVPVGQARNTRRSLGETPRMMEFFSRRFGVSFPWSRYSQVVVSDFIFGGMENTTATTLYEHVMLDERAALDISSNDLVAHELAHQWFGDYVTCRDWSHGWLNEGFATFSEHLEREDRLGRDEYDYGIEGDVDTYLSEAQGRYQRPIVCRDYVEPIDLFDRHLYEKGGLVLHMLRRELGEAVFFGAVKSYLERHAFGLVETNDLMRAFEQASGQSLERFFDQWVYRPGHPELTVKISWEDGLLSVGVKQTQKLGDVATFTLPVEIEVASKNGTLTRHRKTMTDAHDVLSVRLEQRPAWVGFDPELRLPTRVMLEAPADLLRAQLESGSNARLRWVAADALGKRQDPATVRALAEALGRQNETWMVRVEVARALGKLRSDEALLALLAAASTDHPKVRRAVAGALGGFKKPAAAERLAALAEQDVSYLVAADAARSLGRTRQPGALDKLKKIVDRSSWADVIRAGALDGMAQLRDEDALGSVIPRTRYGIPTRGRRAAVHALATLGEGKRTRQQLEDLLEDRDPHFKIDVVSALLGFGDAKSRPALRRALDRELDGRVARRLREGLRDLSESGNGDKKRAQDELEVLKDELSQLKLRFAKLEARSEKSKAKGGRDPETETQVEKSERGQAVALSPKAAKVKSRAVRAAATPKAKGAARAAATPKASAKNSPLPATKSKKQVVARGRATKDAGARKKPRKK